MLSKAGLYRVVLTGMLALAPAVSHATLVVTPAGATEGFSLSTFAFNFPNTGFCCGPLGIAFPNSGGVMVADYPGNVRVFPTDANGQDAGAVPVAQNYGSHNGVGLANLNGSIYMTEQLSGEVVKLNNDGTFNSNVVALALATGIAADNADGVLYVSNISSGIYRIDPVAHTSNLFVGGSFDGLSFDPVHGVVYGLLNGNDIAGFRISDGLQVFNSGFIPDSPDGTALGSGILAGKIYANTNAGTVIEIDMNTLTQTVIATGGSRGDFVTVDPNGSLLLTQTDSIIRLNPPTGGGFGNTPEPASVLLTLGGLATFMYFRKHAA